MYTDHTRVTAKGWTYVMVGWGGGEEVGAGKDARIIDERSMGGAMWWA